MSQRLKAMLPWWGRIPAKVLLASLPIGTKHLKKLGLFNHGDMDSMEYAAKVFDLHMDACRRATGTTPAEGFVAMELGPGDSLLSAVLAWGAGASRTYMVDVGDFAQRDLDLYVDMARRVNEASARKIPLEKVHSGDEVVRACAGEYETDGLESLRKMPPGCVDFCWSHAVLHAIRRAEFLETMREVWRVMRRGGICSHDVDLRDMLGGSLNHLRFSQEAWEWDVAARAGFYANRMRYSEMLEAFRKCGFEVLLAEPQRWERLPVERRKMFRCFQDLPQEELLTWGFHVVLRAA
jgi:SAM-dependent methyltransferase